VRGRETFSVLEEFVLEIGILDFNFHTKIGGRELAVLEVLFLKFYIPLSNWVDVNFMSLEFVGGGGEVFEEGRYRRGIGEEITQL
jgi:hypothetical protein